MDVFELNTYGWEDDVDDLPLTYTFAYVSGSADAADTSSEMIVRAALESSEATDVYLPQVGIARAGCWDCSGREHVRLRVQRGLLNDQIAFPGWVV